MPATLESKIADHLATWERAHVELAIYGSDDPRLIARTIDRFSRAALGSPVQDGLFYQSSVGAVAGVGLADGRRAVIKAHQPDWSEEHLRAIVTLQRHVASSCGVAPDVLAGPAPLGNGLAVVEEFVERGVNRDAHDATIRARLAGELPRLISCLDGFVPSVELRPHPLASLPANALWPRPHSKLFDFETDRQGAEYSTVSRERPASASEAWDAP